MMAATGYSSLQSETLALSIINRDPNVQMTRGSGAKTEGMTVTFGEVIGRGSTCLVYHAVYEKDGKREPCVVKEFYPRGIGVIREVDEEGIVHLKPGPDDKEEFDSRKKQFNDSIDNYYYIAGIKELKDTIPALKYVAVNGQGLFQIFDKNIGECIDKIKWEKETHKTCLTMLECLARSLGHWHAHDLMLLDLSLGNIFWTKEHNLIRFIDFDSLLIKDGVEWHPPVGQKARYSKEYLSGELDIVIGDRGDYPDLEAEVVRHVSERVNYSFIGRLLYKMVFGRNPSFDEQSEDAIRSEIENLKKRYPAVFGARKGKSAAEHLKNLLVRLLTSRIGSAYQSADCIIKDLQTLSRDIIECFKDTEMYRLDILAADILEKHPAYKYCSYITSYGAEFPYHSSNSIGGYMEDDRFISLADVRRTIDILIAGSHPFRLSLLKYMLSCLQMENTELRIHLAAGSVQDEWDTLRGAKESEGDENDLLRAETWPLLDRCVVWRDTRGLVHDCIGGGNEVVSGKLASVYLYADDSAEKVKKIAEEYNVRYMFLLGDEQQNADIIDSLRERKDEIFIGYLADSEEFVAGSLADNEEFVVGSLTESGKSKCGSDILAITRKAVFEKLNEELVHRHIYQKGFLVHKEYELGLDPGADRVRIEENYKESNYNQLNSIRTALHAGFKMASLGIDPESEDAAWQYYDKVLAHRDNPYYRDVFDSQIALEHRSWTAYQIATGGMRPGDVEELNKYAFAGKSFWQDKSDPSHIVHLCISSSKSGRPLAGEDVWSGFDAACRGDIDKISIVEDILRDLTFKYDLDELDRASLRLHFIIECRKRTNRDNIDRLLKELTRLSPKGYSGFRDHIRQLKEIWGQLQYNAQNAASRWKEARSALAETVDSDDKNIKGKLDELDAAIAPYIKLPEQHDFKISDEDMITSLPRLFIQTRNAEEGKIGGFSVAAQFTGSMYRDLSAALMTEPDRLFLVSDGPARKFIREYLPAYTALLRNRSIKTEVIFCDGNTLSTYDTGHIYIDLTHADRKKMSITCRILSGKGKLSRMIFCPGSGDYVGLDGDHSIEMLQRPVFLPVRAGLYMHGLSGSPDAVHGTTPILTANEASALWSLYRSGAYDELSEAIREFDRDHCKWDIAPGKEEPLGYGKELPKTLLEKSGLVSVLRKLTDEGFLDKFAITDADYGEYLDLETVYPDILRTLKKIIKYLRMTECDEASHNFTVKRGDSSLSIRDISRHVSVDVDEDEKLFGVLSKYSDREDVSYLIRWCEEDVRYTSIGVHEALRDERCLLRYVIYSECRRKKVFDDISLDVTGAFDGLKPDLVGVKEGHIYPILIRENQETDTTEYYRYKEIAGKSSGRVIYILTRQSGKGPKDENVRYMLTEELAEKRTDQNTGASSYILCLAKKIKNAMV